MSQVFTVSLHTPLPLPFSLCLQEALLIDSLGQESCPLGSLLPSRVEDSISTLLSLPLHQCLAIHLIQQLPPQGVSLSSLLDNGFLKDRDIFRKCSLNARILTVSWSLYDFSNSRLIETPVPLKSQRINWRPQA